MEENKNLNNELNQINAEIQTETENAIQNKEAEKETKVKEVKPKKEYTIKFMPDELYVNNGGKAIQAYSVFSTLDILNKNSDLFYPTKNTVSSALRMIYTTKELNKVVEETNSSSIDKLAKKVEKALNGKNNDVKINAVASQVGEFLNNIQIQEKISSDGTEYDVASGNKIVDKLASGPYNLINQVTKVYGTNRYIDIETTPLELTPLYAKFYDEAKGVAKINEIEKHIKDVYGYNVTYSQAKNPIHIFKKTLKLTKYESGLDSCVNMLYSTAQTLVGSKKVGKKLAEQTLAKNNDSEFFNSKTYDNKKVKQIYNEQKNTIKDVVSTLSTIFMARFVFEAPEFGEIERDLTEQACKKMQTLRIGNDPNEDYWINQFIEDRLKVNVSQILTANNITKADQLLKIYNQNGTKVLNPESVTNLNDLVFALQYNENIFVDNEKLTNLKENSLQAKAKVKNNKVKVKKPTRLDNYLNNVIRKSDEYKKYYAEYLKKYKQLAQVELRIQNEQTKSELLKISSNLDENLNKLAELSEKSKDNAELTAACTNLTAKTDAFKTAVFEELNKSDEDVESAIGAKKEVVSNEPANQDSTKYGKYSVLENHDAESVNASEGQVVMEDVYPNNGEQLKIQLSSQNRLGNLSDEKVQRKIEKYYQNMVFGSKGKTGIISKMLNYRMTEKSNKKSTTYLSDNERLDDKDLNKANKIRDEQANGTIEAVSNLTYKYYLLNKENLKDETVSKLCAKAIKNELAVSDEETFNHSDVKKVLAIDIAKATNKELKQYNIELYTGKKTYKEYSKYLENYETKNDEKELN